MYDQSDTFQPILWLEILARRAKSPVTGYSTSFSSVHSVNLNSYYTKRSSGTRAFNRVVVVDVVLYIAQYYTCITSTPINQSQYTDKTFLSYSKPLNPHEYNNASTGGNVSFIGYIFCGITHVTCHRCQKERTWK